MLPENYFDHAATSPVEPEALHAMLPWLGELFGNPNSVHQFGVRAKAALESARESLALSLGAEDPAQLIFVSGATEANHWIARQFGKDLAYSPFEHSSMLESAKLYEGKSLPNQGYSVPIDDSESRAVALIHTCNETGACPSLAGGNPSWLHQDITQSVGHVPFDLSRMQSASLSGHKFGAPAGIGLLYCQDPLGLQPGMVGGEQEWGLRSGTSPVALAVALAAAARVSIERREERTQQYLVLRNLVFDELSDLVGWSTDPESIRSPHILSLSFQRIEGETLVLEMDAAGFAISSGAACSSHSTKPNHVLMALGYSESQRRGTIRISFGPQNSQDSTIEMCRHLKKCVLSLRDKFI